jgi:RimJ/RimL family protein N-acetyltransferase
VTALAELEVCASRDAHELYQFLARDRIRAAYLIADLESPLWESSRFWLARRRGETAALAFLFNPGHFTSLLTLGDAAGVQAILDQLPEPPETVYFSAERPHLRALRRLYHLESSDKMRRLAVAADSFRPRANGAVRLGERDLPEVKRAYCRGEGSPFFVEMFLRGVYYGLFRQGRLVSIAGTHFISPAYSLAAVGNVWTLEEARGRGYATTCTGAVTADLLKLCREVVLNVREDNHPARRVYDKLGYRTHCTYWEGRGWRRPRR